MCSAGMVCGTAPRSSGRRASRLGASNGLMTAVGCSLVGVGELRKASDMVALG